MDDFRKRHINPEQLAGALRQLLLVGSGAAGTWLVTRGYVSTATWTEVILPLGGPLLTLAATVYWGWWARSDRNLVKSAQAVPKPKKKNAQAGPK